MFPTISGPLQLTNDNHEHLLASYYGINSLDRSQRYATVLQTDIKHHLPEADEPATLGLSDIKTGEFIPLTKARAWNFQQGCMAHWLGPVSDSLIIYNDIRQGKCVAVIMDVLTREEVKIISQPISGVSPNGREAVSINYSRLRLTRPDYGYGGHGQDARAAIALPEDDGLFLIDLTSGESRLLVSFRQVEKLIPPLAHGQIAWFNHTLFSRNGSRIFWFSRQQEAGSRTTTSLTVDREGGNLQRSFPDHWHGSHYDWLNDRELMVTAKFEGRQYTHVLFTIGQQDYKRPGGGLLDFDGHGCFSPDGRWLLTDTYPSAGLNEQKIYLLNMASEAVISLGRFFEPSEFSGFWRCDLHARWSPKGDMILFNSTRTGSRQVYLYQLS